MTNDYNDYGDKNVSTTQLPARTNVAVSLELLVDARLCVFIDKERLYVVVLQVQASMLGERPLLQHLLSALVSLKIGRND